MTTILEGPREGAERDRRPEARAGSREFVRMTLGDRWQHGVLIVSFLLLVLTGLPLVFYDWSVFEVLPSFHLTFELRGLIHRGAALLLIGLAVWHAAFVIFTSRGRALVRDMLPHSRDALDAWETLMHNLGLTAWLFRRGRLTRFFRRHPYWLFREHPSCGRFSFVEKFEYWAVVWGTFVMIVTGIFLWRVDLAMLLFPRYVFDVFVAIHGYEAILAFLAIIIWHMYTVHLRPGIFPMSRVWLTGKIGEEQMKHEHALEYRDIMSARPEEERRA